MPSRAPTFAKRTAPPLNGPSAFFAGDTFHSVLRAVQAQPRRFKVYEKAGTLRITVQDVKNVQVAKAALESVVSVEV